MMVMVMVPASIIIISSDTTRHLHGRLSPMSIFLALPSEIFIHADTDHWQLTTAWHSLAYPVPDDVFGICKFGGRQNTDKMSY